MHFTPPLRLCLGPLILALLACGFANSVIGQIRVTQGGGTDAKLNDGSRWDRAYSAAQLAARLGSVSRGGSSGEYWLAMGAYSDLMLHRGVVIYGGFAGTENSRGERDPIKNQTTLMGLKFYTYEVRTAEGDFVKFENPEESVLVDGCKIFPSENSTAVTVNFSSGVEYKGAPVLTNCEVVGNLALLGAVNIGNGPLKFVDCTIRSSQGPGIFVGNTQGLVELLRCTVSNNRGAGIQAMTGSKVVVSSSTIRNNGTGRYVGFGGLSSGLRLDDASADIRGTLITSNEGGSGGGVNCFFPSTSTQRVMIRDSVISSNTTFEKFQGTGGGGVYLQVYRPTSPDLVTLTNCVIVGNESTNRGGGVYVRGSGARILACTISTNVSGAEGGGIYTGLEPTTEEPGTARVSIQSSVIAGNRSKLHGGGIATIDTNPEILNCTIAHNSAGTNGGGVYSLWGRSTGNFQWSPPTLVNCAIFGNQAVRGSVLLHSIGTYAGPINNAPPAPALMACAYDAGGTLLRYWEYGPTEPLAITPGNYAVSSPGFENPAAANYRLAQGSPLIDKGTNHSAFGFITTDRDGALRPVGPLPDIGAFEAGAAAPPPRVLVKLTGGKLQIQAITGRLQVTESLTAPTWQDVPEASNGIQVEPAGAQRFWRAVQ